MDNVIHEALTKGLELQKSGQSALAKQLYLSTLQLAPRHSKANHLLGKLEIQCGNFDQAEEFLRISLESNLKSIYCWIDYITVLVQLNEIEVAQQLYFLAQLHDFTEDEISILRKRFETSEFKACSLLRRVKHTAASGTQSPSLSIIEKLEDHYSKRNYITLFKLCFKLVHEYTRSAEIWNFLGASSLHLGSNEDAIYAFKKVTKIRPNYADSFKNLAIGLKKSGALNEAIKNYEKAIKINPDDYHAYNSIGTILDEQGRLNEALKFYKKAVSINQKDINSQNNLGLTYHRLRQYKDAVDTFNLAISLSPNIAQLYNNLGNSQKSQHENYKAMENYNKALQLLPEYQEAQMNLIDLLNYVVPANTKENLIVELDQKIRAVGANLSRLQPSSKGIEGIVNKCLNFVDQANLNVTFPVTQIHRRNSVNLNCDRHMLLFNKHSIIPKFCFSCFKIQIEPKSIIELLMLYILFDELELENNNSRKCMVELRSNVSGFYKGFIYCSSICEAHQVKNLLDNKLLDNFGTAFPSIVKRGCSEYSLAHPEYSNLETGADKLMIYDERWQEVERNFDSANLTLANPEPVAPHLRGVSLNDILVIQNCIQYAHAIDDPTVQNLSLLQTRANEIFDIARQRLR